MTSRRTFTGVAVTIALSVSACLWSLQFLVLLALGDEGALPPRSRIPDVPSGASVISETRQCGSGGCWWHVTVAPAPGQSPADLADEMGLSEDRSEPPTLFDPGFVDVGAEPRDGRLVIYVGYR